MDDNNRRKPSKKKSSKSGDKPKPVKSMAVVKFAPVQIPSFLRLQCNTDLNAPPSNWLSPTVHTYGLHPPNPHYHDFSSFRMAHQFPDCAGEVDVISDAENIKKLLKMPLSPNTVISMIVHRVGNALLIDDFDLTTYLLHRSQDDWQWLSSFIFESIMRKLTIKDIREVMKSKTLNELQRKNLLSKFLYRSISDGIVEQNDHEIFDVESTSQNDDIEEHDVQQQGLELPEFVPEANLYKDMPGSNNKHTFARNVVWTFEDIRMLIGTDMPIFGGASRPCISLRLDDISKPINVLTGIDYWLDNLMSNVPEVMMCFHLDGFVQKYEPIKTEDLPNLENSKFAPKMITNVAKNILAFLKANATKAGHTYWLFKGSNDELVKLYDLTTLCAKKTDVEDVDFEDSIDNPFTNPVAILLYTVAKNMKDSAVKHSAQRAGSIKTLLENCVKLLPNEKYPQIVASSYYILSDLYVPSSTDPCKPDFEDPPDDSENAYDDEDYPRFGDTDDDDDDLDYDSDSSGEGPVAFKHLKDTTENCKLKTNWNALPPPLSGSIVERCNMALQYMRKGLECLRTHVIQHNKDVDDEMELLKLKRKILYDEQHLNILHGNEVIPLHWKKNDDHRLEDVDDDECDNGYMHNSTKNDSDVEEYQPTTSINSWHNHLKALMYQKVAVVYATLAEINYAHHNYGEALLYIDMGLACEQIVQQFVPDRSHRMSCLYGRAGDICVRMVDRELENFLKEWDDIQDIEEFFLEDLPGEKESEEVFSQLKVRMQGILTVSYSCYETAIRLNSTNPQTEHIEKTLLLRLGNINNELAVKGMGLCQDIIDDYPNPPVAAMQRAKYEKFVSLIPQIVENFNKALGVFELIEDNLNYALVLCNNGRFMKVQARMHLYIHRGELFKKYYLEAIDLYNAALTKLDKSVNPHYWKLFTWELGTCYFNLAILLFDEVNPSDRDIVELLQKSEKTCEVINNFDNSDHERTFKRMALIHKRICQFYVLCYSNVDVTDYKKRKTFCHLALINFEKIQKIYETGLIRDGDYLNAYAQRIELEVAQGRLGQPTKKQREFHLLTAFDFMTEAWNGFIPFTSKSIGDDDTDKAVCEFEKLLQRTLKEMIQTIGKPQPDQTVEVYNSNFYKNLYKLSLRFPLKADRAVIEQSITNVLKHFNFA